MFSHDNTKEMYKHLLEKNAKKPRCELHDELPSLTTSLDEIEKILPFFEPQLLEKISMETDTALLERGLAICKKMIREELGKITQGKAHHFATECKTHLKESESPQIIYLGNKDQPTHYQHFKKSFFFEESQFESLLNTYNALVTRLGVLLKKQQTDLIKANTREKDLPSSIPDHRFGF